MWESLFEVDEESSLEADSLKQGCSSSSAHLRSALQNRINSKIPLSILAAWGSKANRLTSQKGITQERKRDECSHCALPFRRKLCFTLQVKVARNGSRRLIAVCKGCGTSHFAGDLPQLTNQSSTGNVSLNQTSGSLMNLSLTSSHNTPIAMSTPLPKGKCATPLTNPRITQIQGNRKPKKRRGSALEKLLKEEDSESDRSLGGFLNMFSL